MERDRRAPWMWAAVVVPAWLAMIACAYWEPVIGDGWGHIQYHREYPLSLHSVWIFIHDSYLYMNPRLGQLPTMVLYTEGPLHAIVTPLVELLLFYLLATLALGRRPRLDRRDDALVFATIFALVAACAPLFGQMLFYRPYTGNYLYGFVISLAFVVPYRLHLEAPRAWAWWWSVPVMLVAGAAAGLCNEHTGPAFAGAAVAACVHARRPRVWMIAGVVGIAAGGIALLLAPGQDLRYSGLATHDTMLGRIAARGLAGNLKPIGQVLLYVTPTVAWLALGWGASRGQRVALPRSRAIAALACVAVAAIAVATLLLSPKLGARLYLASIALACTAAASWVVPQLVPRWSRVVAWVLAAGVLVYVLGRCVLAYHEVGPEFTARYEALAHAPPRSRLALPAYTVGKSRWFFGDDFLLKGRVEAIADQFGLEAVVMDQRPATAPADDDP